ncbi:MAG: hypothetical protein A2293_04620 [Elusimicrobia bacterium RIFOXYB2_FULL_49_7]|nr:MAG: hypothetical protein A2293_04620 [Elusimicrobia bacterium RIFOXYB2_FULL_49_7]
MNKIAFLGERGTFSELAAVKFFAGRTRTHSCRGFEEIFQCVANGRCRYGIVPIENSLSGSIHQNYDLLLNHDVWICGELKLRISHCLIANPGTKLSDLRRVFSHPVALAQCQRFLKKLKGVKSFSYRDTAGSVLHIKENGFCDAAAIASQQVAEDHHMTILKSRIEDNVKNFTRFFVMTKKKVPVKGPCKTSIVFALKNVPGALYKSLSIFAIRDINLYKIESRPIPGSPWKYMFYLDFEGRYNDPVIQKTLTHLQEISNYFKVMGSYPIGKEVEPG